MHREIMSTIRPTFTYENLLAEVIRNIYYAFVYGDPDEMELHLRALIAILPPDISKKIEETMEEKLETISSDDVEEVNLEDMVSRFTERKLEAMYEVMKTAVTLVIQAGILAKRRGWTLPPPVKVEVET